MIQRIRKKKFVDIMQADPYSDYSTEACEVIFDSLEEIEPNFELDLAYIRGEFVESSVQNIITDYNIEIDEDEALDEHDKISQVIDYLEKKTYVLGLGGSETTTIVYINF